MTELSELKEIRQMWSKRYPNVMTILWSNHDKDKYFGKMMTHEKNTILEASTIGDLIEQGETFLRKIR